MTLDILAIIFDYSGKLLIAITVLLVHKRVRTEKRIDKRVLKEMKAEQAMGIVGIVLLTGGFILNLIVNS